jgi:hypothetical protein
MKRALLVIMFGTLYVLHQDFWFWRTANPLAFGFIPVGLLYHACYTLATAFALWLLVKYAWPSELEEGGGDEEIERLGDGETGRRGDYAVSPDRPVALPPRLPVSSSEEGDAR